MSKTKHTLSELVSLNDELKKIMEEADNGELRFEIYELLSEISPTIESFNSTRNDLIKRYGTEKEDGSFQVESEKYPDFIKEISSILQKEYSVNKTLSRSHLKELKSKNSFMVFKFSK